MADLSLGEAMALSKNNDGFLEGNGIIILILFFLIFGFGGYNGGRNQDAASKSDVTAGFQANQIDNGIRGIQNGLCDGFYAINNSIQGIGNQLGLNMLQGFNGVQRDVSNSTYDLKGSIDRCCCETGRHIDGVRYEMSKGFCDVITNANMNTRDILESNCANTRAIIDRINSYEVQNLRDRLQNINQSLSNQVLANNIVQQVKPCPVPAYTVCSPYCSGQ